MKVFAVMDKRIGEYKPPMFFEHQAECVRVMEQVVNNPDSDLNKWPLDFQLDRIGEFNRKTGEMKLDRDEICQVADLIKKEKQEVDRTTPLKKGH